MNGSSETMNAHHLNNGSAHCGAQNASGSSNGHSGVGGHPTKKIVVLVAGAAGFIGSHMARRLKHDPAGRFTVVGADVRTNDYMQPDEFCDVFHQVDLRKRENCLEVTKGCHWVFNFAADMGGMGYIQSNQAYILYNNTMITFNMAEASRLNGVQRYLYTSSACVYPEHKQETEDNPGLREGDAWPARPQDAYGMEKLYGEVLCKHYMEDYHMEMRVARLHNIYGPKGAWKGGREKAPAAFCRKVICSRDNFEMWGDGLQTRSFCFIDDCVEGLMRLMQSDVREPLNIGSDEMVSMQEMARMICAFDNKPLGFTYTSGPMGVRGRNSNNDLIRERLGWAPSTRLVDGLRATYDWVKVQVARDQANGLDVHGPDYSSSRVVVRADRTAAAVPAVDDNNVNVNVETSAELKKKDVEM